MSNMSYCKFENTVSDMRDCIDTLDEIMGNVDDLSESEARHAKRFITLCLRVAADFGDE